MTAATGVKWSDFHLVQGCKVIDTRTAAEIGVGSKENCILKSPVRLAPSMPQIYDAIVRRMEVWRCVSSLHRPMPQDGSRAALRVTGNASRTDEMQSQTLLSLEGCCHRRNIRDYCGSDLVGRLLAVVFAQRSGTPESASILAWERISFASTKVTEC